MSRRDSLEQRQFDAAELGDINTHRLEMGMPALEPYVPDVVDHSEFRANTRRLGVHELLKWDIPKGFPESSMRDALHGKTPDLHGPRFLTRRYRQVLYVIRVR